MIAYWGFAVALGSLTRDVSSIGNLDPSLQHSQGVCLVELRMSREISAPLQFERSPPVTASPDAYLETCMSRRNNLPGRISTIKLIYFRKEHTILRWCALQGFQNRKEGGNLGAWRWVALSCHLCEPMQQTFAFYLTLCFLKSHKMILVTQFLRFLILSITCVEKKGSRGPWKVQQARNSIITITENAEMRA